MRDNLGRSDGTLDNDSSSSLIITWKSFVLFALSTFNDSISSSLSSSRRFLLDGLSVSEESDLSLFVSSVKCKLILILIYKKVGDRSIIFYQHTLLTIFTINVPLNFHFRIRGITEHSYAVSRIAIWNFTSSHMLPNYCLKIKLNKWQKYICR